MDDGFIRLSIFGIFLLGYLRSSEVVVVVVVFFTEVLLPRHQLRFLFKKKGLLKSSVFRQNVPYIIF